MTTLRIGILGAAAIAPAAIVKPGRDVDRAEVVAVAARDRSRAAAFAAKWSIPTVHDSYEALIADPGIDAVYNPLPNALHAEWTVAALRAGKHVLCEKPLTSNAAQAREVAAVATETGRVLMEAFHYRYHPMMQGAVDTVRSGELGEVRRVESWMQIPLFKRSDIRFDLALGGGAVMDLGCYSIHQLRSIMGEEPVVTAAESKQRRSDPGVDRWMRADFRFPSGATGRITASLYGACPLRVGFRVVGSSGTLTVLNPPRPHVYHRFVVTSPDGSKQRRRFPKVATYTCQLEAFCDAVIDGVPLLAGVDDAIANMDVIDAVYTAAGLPLRP